MKTFASLNSQGRLYAVLFSSAVLASGCGGNVDQPGDGTSMASEVRAVPAPAALNASVAAGAADQAESGAAAAPDPQAGLPAAAANFEMSGYQNSAAGAASAAFAPAPQ